MNEDFIELKKLFIAEYRNFLNLKESHTQLRSLATMASMVGSMRAIREYADEKLTSPDQVEKAESIIETKVIPAIL